jgi:hypothetical protein
MATVYPRPGRAHAVVSAGERISELLTPTLAGRTCAYETTMIVVVVTRAR